MVSYGQMSQHPPAPKMNDMETFADTTPCDPDNDPGTPPPVGLCVPIDEHLLLLLLSGLSYGLYKTHKIQQGRR